MAINQNLAFNNTIYSILKASPYQSYQLNKSIILGVKFSKSEEKRIKLKEFKKKRKKEKRRKKMGWAVPSSGQVRLSRVDLQIIFV